MQRLLSGIDAGAVDDFAQKWKYFHSDFQFGADNSITL